MPYGEPDASDPMVLMGVELPTDAEGMRDMAWVFAEEFARLGLAEARILGLFRSPFYAGAHGAWLALGEIEVAAIVAECARVWGRRGEPSPGGEEG
jgi:hypothetical protein